MKKEHMGAGMLHIRYGSDLNKASLRDGIWPDFQCSEEANHEAIPVSQVEASSS